MSNNTSVSTGMGFSGWLTILFVGLKLTGFISWPWIWVISPLWISFLVGITILAIMIIIAFASGIWK